jgi:hypothetical protein
VLSRRRFPAYDLATELTDGRRAGVNELVVSPAIGTDLWHPDDKMLHHKSACTQTLDKLVIELTEGETLTFSGALLGGDDTCKQEKDRCSMSEKASENLVSARDRDVTFRVHAYVVIVLRIVSGPLMPHAHRGTT